MFYDDELELEDEEFTSNFCDDEDDEEYNDDYDLDDDDNFYEEKQRQDEEYAEELQEVDYYR